MNPDITSPWIICQLVYLPESIRKSILFAYNVLSLGLKTLKISFQLDDIYTCVFHLQSLRDFVKNLLETASRNGFQSIAIPAIGTGYLGFPHDVVASTIHSTVSQFMRENLSTSLKKVVLVVHSKDDKSVKVRFLYMYGSPLGYYLII